VDYDNQRARANREQLAALIAHWEAQPMPLVQLRGVLEFGIERMALELGCSRQFYKKIEKREKPLPIRLLVDVLDNWRPELEVAGVCCEQLIRCTRALAKPPPVEVKQ
jgi:hypothetical protein